VKRLAKVVSHETVVGKEPATDDPSQHNPSNHVIGYQQREQKQPYRQRIKGPAGALVSGVIEYVAAPVGV
jgi:hypothetical protein